MAGKPKLILAASPRFKSKVGIPIPGEEKTAPVEFVFRHRTKTALKEWKDSIAPEVEKDGIVAQHVLDMAESWELDDPFTVESITQMLEEYPGSGTAIYIKYLTELQDAKLGNFVR